jgi:hypothetical protein
MRLREVLLSAFVMLCLSTSGFAQEQASADGLHWYTTVKPWRQGTIETARRQSAAATTLPLWGFNVNSSRDGNNYSGTIVGRSPFFHGARTTNIHVFIVPLKIHMPDTGHTFDPTVADPFGCLPTGSTALSLTQGSPIFQSPASDWIFNGADVGSGQYLDVFQRAEFFDDVSVTGNRYHTTLSPVTTLAASVFNVPSGEGQTYDATSFGGCGDIGVVDVATMDSFLTNTLIPSLGPKGVGPTNFPLFVLYNVVMGDPGTSLFSNCCILGYHGATGFPMQTYSPTDFDSTSIFSHTGNTSILAHEIGEMFNDPTGNNPTPAWGHTGQVTGCQNNLEVGDPLSGTLMPAVTMPDGFSYDLQELAFFSWFFGSPSIGAGGSFSNNATFKTDAGAPCT